MLRAQRQDVHSTPIEALSEVDLDRLEQSKIREETKKLEHLDPEKW
jgi:hypothetical protein